MAYLILTRHGQSEWNAKGLWTGWTGNVPLTKTGEKEAAETAKELCGISIDSGFVSDQKRSIDTLDIIKKCNTLENLPIEQTPDLKERNYGELTGKNKWEIKKQYGEETFQKIRRSFDYPIPRGETLKDVYNRVVPYYKKRILPQLQDGKSVIVVASGNSIRALVKYLENISDEDIAHLELATAESYVYTVDKDGAIIAKEKRATRPNSM